MTKKFSLKAICKQFLPFTLIKARNLKMSILPLFSVILV